MGEMKAKKLPDFSKMTMEEIASFWDEHDSTDYWDQMKEAKAEFKEPLNETPSVKIHSADLHHSHHSPPHPREPQSRR